MRLFNNFVLDKFVIMQYNKHPMIGGIKYGQADQKIIPQADCRRN